MITHQEQQPTVSAQILPIAGDAASRLCAWCLAAQGIPAGEGSHGICKFHKAQLLAQAARLRAARRRKKVARWFKTLIPSFIQTTQPPQGARP